MSLNHQPKKVAVVCKLMPLYRLGVFQELSSFQGDLEFTLFGDVKKQAGIENINWEYASRPNGEGLRWKKTKNYFYKPELLLWQTGIIRNILFSKYKIFIFEGAVSHLPIWLFALLLKIVNKKVLFWTHGFKGTDKKFKKLIRKFFFKYLADGLLLYGNHQKNVMISEGFIPNKISVIYNSLRPQEQFFALKNINYRNLQKEKMQIFKNSFAFTIIFIGRLVVGKKVDYILEACKILKYYECEINCIFIGDGPEKSSMIDFCQKNNLNDNVFFAGSLYRESDIAKYFVMSNLMVSPGNVGLNCIHSLAYGVPVLTHNNFVYQNPEVEAIVDGETGFFYEYDNFDDMILILKKCINGNHDKKKISLKCQKMIVKLYNPKNQAACIANAVRSFNEN